MKGIHNHTALLILAIAVTLVVGVAYGYMWYALAAAAERAVLAQDIVRVEEVNKNHEQDLINLYESTAANRSKLSTLFISSDSVVTFIEAIESLGKDAGSSVAISSIDADRVPSSPGSYGSVRGKVDVRGQWSSVMRTLLLAESLPYIIHIDHVRLDTSLLEGDRSSKREWHLSFDITAAIK